MEKIASFTVDHLRLEPGIYVSRQDTVQGAAVTTFDLRITKPNDEPVMNTAEIHAMEHLGATFLRNHPQWKDKTLYFGPMGCRTGFYLLLAGLRPLLRRFSSLFGTMKEKSPAQVPKTAVISWISVSPWQNTGQDAIWNGRYTR